MDTQLSLHSRGHIFSKRESVFTAVATDCHAEFQFGRLFAQNISSYRAPIQFEHCGSGLLTNSDRILFVLFSAGASIEVVLDVGLSRVLSASKADRLHAAVGREFVLNIFVGTTPLRVCEEHRTGGSILSGQLHCKFVSYTEQGGEYYFVHFFVFKFRHLHLVKRRRNSIIVYSRRGCRESLSC